MDVSRGDNEFNLNALRENIRLESSKICAKGRHITIIDRSIQFIKKGARLTTYSFTYNRYAKLITGLLVECNINSKNSLPPKGSISKGLGSNMILLGKPSTDFNINIIFFGSYAMVYTGTTNTPNIRSIPSIVLRE